ncbi:uncharacterized protein DUF4244 [Curtobacterium flaccumfaciens]|uniref:Uncharacterized protein DUF4244 n=1 Tax=Curtobacterium flaccumfaciens TaxID=2035 RepID=A0A4R6DLN6_9MICO|nr:uncharacterized protein DUF4244 [Curtobacterium flaccumfaciens]
MTDTPTSTTSTPHRARTRARARSRSRIRTGVGAGLRRRLRDDRGSATAEYAVVILAAVAFAGVLVAVMRSGEVQGILTELVRGALSL